MSAFYYGIVLVTLVFLSTESHACQDAYMQCMLANQGQGAEACMQTLMQCNNVGSSATGTGTTTGTSGYGTTSTSNSTTASGSTEMDALMQLMTGMGAGAGMPMGPNSEAIAAAKAKLATAAKEAQEILDNSSTVNDPFRVHNAIRALEVAKTELEQAREAQKGSVTTMLAQAKAERERQEKEEEQQFLMFLMQNKDK